MVPHSQWRQDRHHGHRLYHRPRRRTLLVTHAARDPPNPGKSRPPIARYRGPKSSSQLHLVVPALLVSVGNAVSTVSVRGWIGVMMIVLFSVVGAVIGGVIFVAFRGSKR